MTLKAQVLRGVMALNFIS